MSNDLHGSQSVPFWKVMILAICAMQIGPALSSAAGYQMHWSGAGAWVAMGAAAVIASLVATAISYLARRNFGTGAILSYVQGVLPRWGVCIVASTLLLGYIIGPSSMTMWAAAYLSSLLVELGIESAATPIAGALLIVVIAALAGFCAYRGVEVSAKVSIALGLVSIPVAVAITVVAATQPGVVVDYSQTLGQLSWAELARGTFVALSFFVGFDGIGALASETSDPRNYAPKLLIGTVVLAGLTDVLGVFFQTPVLLAHASELEAGLTPTYVMMHASGLESSYVLVDLVLYMAQLAGLIAWLNLSALIIATAGRDGFLPRMLGDRHPRTGSPYKTVLVLTLLSIVIPVALQLFAERALLIATAYVTNVLVFLWLIAYCFVCAATMTLHHRNRETIGIAYLSSLAALVGIIGILVAQALHPFDDVYALMNVMAIGLMLTTSLALFLSKRHRDDALDLLAQ